MARKGKKKERPHLVCAQPGPKTSAFDSNTSVGATIPAPRASDACAASASAFFPHLALCVGGSEWAGCRFGTPTAQCCPALATWQRSCPFWRLEKRRLIARPLKSSP